MLIPSSENEGPLVHHDAVSNLPSRTKYCCPFNLTYRLFTVSEKAGIIMIILNTFTVFAVTTSLLNTTFQTEPLDFISILLVVPSGLVLILSPIFGLLGECYFGRYKILQVSLYSLLASIVLIAFIIVAIPRSNWYVALVPICFSASCYTSCIIPFTMDQLVGASGEELSFTIYWLLWPITTSTSTLSLFECTTSFFSIQFQHALLFGTASLSFAISFCLIQCCNHELMTKPQISNLIRLIARVLNYARKHSFPERRSAFTYWEEECPSRIDLGKEKYGGPFTVEEVEDVKTVFKLISMICCTLPVTALGFLIESQFQTISCDNIDLFFWVTFLWILLVISCLPIYQFFIYPVFYNYIPSMLRRIGSGMLVIVLSQALLLVIGSQVQWTTTTSTCSKLKNDEFPVMSWLLLGSHFIRKVGLFITAFSTVEFIIAQAPCQLRGFVTSFSLGLLGISASLGIIMEQTLYDCTFFTAISVIIAILFVLFLFVSKWYRLRKRNDIIPYYKFAEDQFENNYRLEREYLKSRGWLL